MPYALTVIEVLLRPAWLPLPGGMATPASRRTEKPALKLAENTGNVHVGGRTIMPPSLSEEATEIALTGSFNDKCLSFISDHKWEKLYETLGQRMSFSKEVEQNIPEEV